MAEEPTTKKDIISVDTLLDWYERQGEIYRALQRERDKLTSSGPDAARNPDVIAFVHRIHGRGEVLSALALLIMEQTQDS